MRETDPMPALPLHLYEHGQRTVGALPSMQLVAGCFAVVLACGLLISDEAARTTGICALAVVAFYCALRPNARWMVFAISAIPAAGSALVADLFSVSPAAAAVPLLPAMLLALANQDRQDRARREGAA